MSDGGGCTGAEEAIEDEVVGISGDFQNAFQ
jgi:hypothetical protein